MIKTKCKVSEGFRSIVGSRSFAAVRSLISTAKIKRTQYLSNIAESISWREENPLQFKSGHWGLCQMTTLLSLHKNLTTQIHVDIIYEYLKKFFI